ncbi:MAG: hypothetical protein GF311_11120 [Candidatus Lokiarchaeota archaeon]|nr:hypothetical protein [Candidatus Lokiarchaeota archaeon]MBD3213148.1 hypothetical protein [Candidatus Lokiarchaeota archaeon]
MSINKLNRALKILVGKAKGYENVDKIDDAIDTWVEITEMTIKASKNPKLDASYRNMLINRTQGIIAHIKELKNLKEEKYIEKTESKREEFFEELPSAPSHEPSPTPNSDTSQNEPTKSQGPQKSKPYIKKTSDLPSTPKTKPSPDIVEDSEFKNLPKGFKQIKPMSDFDILTPHDPDAVKKREELAKKSEYFNELQKKRNEQSTKKSKSPHTSKSDGGEIQLEKKSEDGKVICFACGETIETKGKLPKCPNCGVDLESSN